jgi:Xaa-Pro dipeptidase
MLFNKTRALEYMRRYDLDVLVATSPVNITYFSDYFCWIDPLFKEYMASPGASSNLVQAYAVFPSEGEPALVVNSLFAVNAADLWVRDLYIFGNPGLDNSLVPMALAESDHSLYDLLNRPPREKGPTDVLMAILEDRKLTEARIGLEMEGLPGLLKETIFQAIPRANIRDCSNFIRLIRMVKSQEEISRLRLGAEINEIAAKEAMALARPGVSVFDLARRFRERAAQQGADFDHFAYGQKGMGIATQSNYVLTRNDVAYLDFGCISEHYFSDSGTTLALTDLSLPLEKRFAALKATIAAGKENLRPGIRASEVQGAMLKAMHAHGVDASFPHGHGLGLELRDYPILVADNGLRIQDGCVDVPSDLPLEPGMVLNLEAGLFAPTVGSLQIEMSYLVTTRGSEPLVSQDRNSPVQPFCP